VSLLAGTLKGMELQLIITAVVVIIGVTLAFVAGYRAGKGSGTTDQERLVAAEQKALGLQAQLDLLTGQHTQLQERHDIDQKILRTLEPVKQTLDRMDQKVQELERQRTSQHSQLSEQLRQVALNDEQLRHTTESLASALRSTATRGRWGEVQLRRVVEAAGLLERVDFDVQTQVSSEQGLGTPDMIVHLPGGKHLAVDAKVPFTAYWDAQQISPAAIGEEAARRQALLGQHVRAVRSHVDALGKKAYWEGLGASPEIVICFLPSEALLSAAIEEDPDLLDWAFSKKVALSSPVTLWSVLKTVAFSWQQDVLTEDAKKLFDAGKELHQRLGSLAGRIESLGKSIGQTVKNYNQFVGTLETRVIPSARRLSAFGDNEELMSDLAAIDEPLRPLTQSELTDQPAIEGSDGD
jgi:DNA recombination protein RmuC